MTSVKTIVKGKQNIYDATASIVYDRLDIVGCDGAIYSIAHLFFLFARKNALVLLGR